MLEGGEKHWGNTVTAVDLAVAVGGLAVLAGLGFEWSDDTSGYSGLSVLKVILLLCGVAALLLPVILAASRRQDLPVVWETILLLVSIPLSTLLLIRLLFPPDGGFGSGYLVVLAGIILVTVATWKTVSREA